MGSRVLLASFLIRLARFLQSLAIRGMRPGDLGEFGRWHYAPVGQ